MLLTQFISKPKFFLLSFLVLAFLSCNSRKEFEQYQKFEKQSWHRFNILAFEVPVSEFRGPFDIAFVIRHLPEFQIKELPINLTIYMPSGEVRSAEHVLNFTGSDGVSRSECLGDLCDISFTLREDFVFPGAGKYRIEVENKWPRLELPGILEAGLIVIHSRN